MPDKSASGASSFPPGVPRTRALVMRFISGKYQGQQFPLLPGREIVIGRAGDIGMVLAEDMVSRRHARISFPPEGIFIEDLGSTNGTFVNGERVERASLREGDRVLIGTSILKVVVVDQSRGPSEEQARREMAAVAAHRRTSQVRSMSGSVEEIPLPDLLQLLGTSRKSGVLVVRTQHDVGRIHLSQGNIVFASINDLAQIPTEKSVFRMLTWTRGTFDLEPPEEPEPTGGVLLQVQSVLMDAMRQLDELTRLKDRLPALTDHLRLEKPLTAALRDLNHQELDILQLSHNLGCVENVLNQSVLSDLDTSRALLKLLDSGYLVVETPPS